MSPQASLEALLDALESAGLGCTVVVASAAGVERVYANSAIARIYGVDLATMRAMPVFDALPAEERARLVKLRTEIRGGELAAPPMVETTIVRPDGTSLPVELGLGYAMLGDKRATFVFARDISAKKAMEAALRESEDRFRQLAETSPDSITVHAGGRYVYANPVALRHLGLRSLDELAAFDPRSTVPPERWPEIREHLASVERGERVAPLVYRRTAPSGEELMLEASISFVKIDGAPAIVSWTRDITERMRLQAELMKHDRLASVGFLAAGVAHELNNPLASLGMHVRKLLEGAEARGLDADTRAALEQIDDAAQRMSTIIADLLFMSRPVEQPQAHVDVAKILTSTVALVRAGVPRCPAITTDIAPLPPIHGYAPKLGQVFFNVLRNAVQAVEARSDGRIEVHARATEQRVEILVRDNGIGIAREHMAHVTQPFFTTKPQGTGLGLWISQAILAHHGGALDVTSDLGAGTTVSVHLPL